MKNILSKKAPVTIVTAVMIVLAFFLTTCEIGDQVKIPSYTIVYNGNGGTGSMGKSIHKYGTETNLTANAFTCEGYGFSGWAEEPAGAVKYQDKQSMKNLTKEDGATISLYAVWVAQVYTVVYNANGGTGSMDNSLHVYGTEKNLNDNAFVRAGYIFTGWARTAVGMKVYDDQESVKNLTTNADETVTLYAVWVANVYTVIYDANGGSGTMENSIHDYGTEKNLNLNAFARSDYIFTGWARTAAGIKVYDDQESVKNLITNAEETITLYAVWAQVYTVAYNSNGGSGIMENSIHVYGIEKNLNDNAFTFTDYVFIGWARTPAGMKVYDDRESVKNLTTNAGETVPLYAQWTPQMYNLTVDIGLNDRDLGTVSPSGTSTHNAGAEVTVTATPTDYTCAFVKWTGPGAPQGTAADNPTITVTMNSDLTLIANFRAKTPKEHPVIVFSNPGSTSWQLPGDVTFPAIVEVYALGAGGGGQGGHMYDIVTLLIFVTTYTGTGGAGGGGAAAYMKFETYTQENFTVNVGRGGTRGSRVIRTYNDEWRPGGVGGKGGDTTVTWSGGTLTVQGGQGGGSPASTTNYSGGAGGNASTKPSAIITQDNWESPAGNKGASGEKDGKSVSRGGDSAALRLTKGWFNFSGETDKYKGGWNDIGALRAYYPGTGAGGPGGWGENNGMAGGDGQVMIRVRWYE